MNISRKIAGPDCGLTPKVAPKDVRVRGPICGIPQPEKKPVKKKKPRKKKED